MITNKENVIKCITLGVVGLSLTFSLLTFSINNTYMIASATDSPLSLVISKDNAISYDSEAVTVDKVTKYNNTLVVQTTFGAIYNVSITNSGTNIRTSSILGSFTTHSFMTISSNYVTADKTFQNIDSIVVTNTASFARKFRLYLNDEIEYTEYQVSARGSKIVDLSSDEVKTFVITGASDSSSISIGSLTINYFCE